MQWLNNGATSKTLFHKDMKDEAQIYTEEYQKFINSMIPLCRCSHDQPCDGLLAGGPCDNNQGSFDDDYRDDDEE